MELVREGDAPPDGNGEYRSFSLSPTLDNVGNGRIGFHAWLRGTTGGTDDDSGIFPALVALSPYKINGVAAQADRAEVTGGEEVTISAAVKADKPDVHALHFRTYGPDGVERRWYANTVFGKAGIAELTIKTALNQNAGKYRQGRRSGQRGRRTGHVYGEMRPEAHRRVCFSTMAAFVTCCHALGADHRLAEAPRSRPGLRRANRLRMRDNAAASHPVTRSVTRFQSQPVTIRHEVDTAAFPDPVT